MIVRVYYLENIIKWDQWDQFVRIIGELYSVLSESIKGSGFVFGSLHPITA